MSNLEEKKTYGLFSNPLNNKLISELENENVLIFPSIKTEKLELTANEKSFLKNLTDFDWIILTDIFAADYFIENLRELEVDFFDLDSLSVCALGETVADRLRFVQVHADIIPPKINDEAVFTVISLFVADELEDLRFLVLGKKHSRFSFIEELKNKKAFVEELPIYQAEFGDETSIIRLQTLLQNGAVDEFIFSSPEDLIGLKLLLPEYELSESFSEIKVSATSEVIYQSLQENNLRPLYFHRK